MKVHILGVRGSTRRTYALKPGEARQLDVFVDDWGPYERAPTQLADR